MQEARTCDVSLEELYLMLGFQLEHLLNPGYLIVCRNDFKLRSLKNYHLIIIY